MDKPDDEILPGQIYKLLLKNVSRDDPLSSDEIQELKEFRSTLTAEQWKGWLHFAREERHALKKQRKRNSPPKLKALVKDPVVLLEALSKFDTASTDSIKIEGNSSAYRRRHEVSWSDYSTSHELVDDRTLSAENNANQRSVGMDLLSAEATVTIPETPSVDDFKTEEHIQPSVEFTTQFLGRHNGHHNWTSDAPHHPIYQQPQHKQQQQQQPEMDDKTQQPGRSSELTYLQHSAKQVKESAQYSSQDCLGVSLERNSVLGRGTQSRSASAPRARSSPVVGGGAAARWTQGQRQPPVVPTNNALTHSPKFRTAPADFFAERPSSFACSQHARQHTGSAAWGQGVSTSPLCPAGRQDPKKQSPANELEVVAASTAEIARSSAFRLESAYSAAQYLLSTMTADEIASTSASKHGMPSLQDDEKLRLSVSILTEMMTSMDKSRIALSHLTGVGPDGLPSGKIGAAGALLPTPAASIGPDLGRAPLHSQRFNPGRESTSGHHWSNGEASFNAAQLPAQQEEHSTAEELSFEASTKLEGLHCPPWQPAFHEQDIGGGGTPRIAVTARSHFAQPRSPGDFSVLNRQMACSAVGDIDGRTDPANELQARLFAATDAARRLSDASVTIAQSPGAPRAQYSYNSAGYVWEGTRHARAQGPVVRVCIAHGPLLKAFDDYPVRVDTEAHAVDVVWRETRIGEAAAQAWGISPFASPASGNRSGLTVDRGSTSRNTVLRRERFSFDDIFHGPTADGRLAMYCRQRTRKALEAGRNLTVLCLGCGDAPAGGESAVEPPVSTLLGSGGGTGLISSVVDEIFRFVRPLSVSMHESGKTFPGSFPTKADSPFVASKLAYEQMRSTVTLSAVILSDRGEIFDLLAPTGPHQQMNATATLKRRKSDGRAVLCNASRLQLQAPSDFDRVMGLLLGKRTALQSVLAALHQQRAHHHAAGIPADAAAAEPLHGLLASIDPWAAFNSRAAERSSEPAACASTMLITVSVSGGVATSGHTSADFHFVSPCGKNWFSPGSDVNMLAELVSALPNTPPQSLLKASPLSLLLLDPKNQASDFVNVVAINRESSRNHLQSRKTTPDVVHGALNSLRIIAQLVQ